MRQTLQPNDVISILSKRGIVRSVRGIKASAPITFVRSYGNDTLCTFLKKIHGIITSKDDALPLILGECDKANFESEIPLNLEEWLMGMDEEISAYLQSDIQIDLTEDTVDDRISISPTIKAHWSQGSPFNNALLMDGKYRQVGCTAISIGQGIILSSDGKKWYDYESTYEKINGEDKYGNIYFGTHVVEFK